MQDEHLLSRQPVPHPGATQWRPADLLNSFPGWRLTVERALLEDAPNGDVTTRWFAPDDKNVTWHLNAREAGTLAGVKVVDAVFSLLPGEVRLNWLLKDGERFSANTTLASLTGPSSTILQVERVALNFLQRLSGVATRTRSYVNAIEESGALLLDTRKTTPGLRAFEKYAVCCGGARTHRKTLSDVIMIKDNHLAALDHDWQRVARLIESLRTESNSAQAGPEVLHVEIEVDRPEQITPALNAGADSLLLDGFALDQLRSAVALVAGRIPLEASGGVTLGTIADIAGTGVDFISVGALTNGYPSLDIGLDADRNTGL